MIKKGVYEKKGVREWRGRERKGRREREGGAREAVKEGKREALGGYDRVES